MPAAKRRSQRSPARGWHGVQFHWRKSIEIFSPHHRLLRPLVLIVKCSFALLGVIRETPKEEELEPFGEDVISLSLPSISCQCDVSSF